eukprot:403342630
MIKDNQQRDISANGAAVGRNFRMDINDKTDSLFPSMRCSVAEEFETTDYKPQANQPVNYMYNSSSLTVNGQLGNSQKAIERRTVNQINNIQGATGMSPKNGIRTQTSLQRKEAKYSSQDIIGDVPPNLQFYSNQSSKPSSNFQLTPHQNKNIPNIEVVELSSIKIPAKEKSLSIFPQGKSLKKQKSDTYESPNLAFNQSQFENSKSSRNQKGSNFIEKTVTLQMSSAATEHQDHKYLQFIKAQAQSTKERSNSLTKRQQQQPIKKYTNVMTEVLQSDRISLSKKQSDQYNPQKNQEQSAMINGFSKQMSIPIGKHQYEEQNSQNQEDSTQRIGMNHSNSSLMFAQTLGVNKVKKPKNAVSKGSKINQKTASLFKASSSDEFKIQSKSQYNLVTANGPKQVLGKQRISNQLHQIKNFASTAKKVQISPMTDVHKTLTKSQSIYPLNTPSKRSNKLFDVESNYSIQGSLTQNLAKFSYLVQPQQKKGTALRNSESDNNLLNLQRQTPSKKIVEIPHMLPYFSVSELNQNTRKNCNTSDIQNSPIQLQQAFPTQVSSLQNQQTSETEIIQPLIFKDNMEIELDESEPYRNLHSVQVLEKEDSFVKIEAHEVFKMDKHSLKINLNSIDSNEVSNNNSCVKMKLSNISSQMSPKNNNKQQSTKNSLFKPGNTTNKVSFDPQVKQNNHQAPTPHTRTMKKKQSKLNHNGFGSTKRINEGIHLAGNIDSFKQLYEMTKKFQSTQPSIKIPSIDDSQQLKSQQTTKTPRARKSGMNLNHNQFQQNQQQINAQLKQVTQKLDKVEQKSSRRKREIIELREENLKLRSLLNHLLQAKLAQ